MSAGAPNKGSHGGSPRKSARCPRTKRNNKPATPRAHSTIHSAAHHCCRVVFENTKRFERVVEHDGSAFRPTR